MNTYCQSCGYPMKKDKKGGGTNADGSINSKYCSMCYANGKFLSPPEVDTAEKFQQFCIQDVYYGPTLPPIMAQSSCL